MIACFVNEEGGGGLEFSSVICHRRQCCGDLGTHHRGCPIDRFRPRALGDGEGVGLHDVEGIQKGGVGRGISAGFLEGGCGMAKCMLRGSTTPVP